MLKIGVVGAGQLCRMFGEEIRKKNINVALIAIDPSPNPPAKEFLYKHIIGDFKDYDKIINLANEVDILTFEIELANFEALEYLESKGKKVYPSSFVLKNIQDKYIQYEFLKRNNIPVPESINLGKNIKIDYEDKDNDINLKLEKLGYPLILKKRRDSYDGRGNFVLKNKDKIKEALNYFGEKDVMAQRFINFSFEVSVVGCRWLDGSITTFPLCFNIHGKDYNILDKTFVINENYLTDEELKYFFYILSKEEGKEIKLLNKNEFIKLKEKAQKIAYDVINSFNSYGVLTVEMMVQIKDNELNKINELIKVNEFDNNFAKIFVNEIAPRVHNSGHYTIESCNISQFEAHIRSIIGEKKISPFLKNKFSCMLNIYGGKEDNGKFDLIYIENIKINNTKNNNKESQKIINGTVEIEEGVFVHNYMKEEVRPYRKIGHITILGKENESIKEFYERVVEIREKVKIKVRDN